MKKLVHATRIHELDDNQTIRYRFILHSFFSIGAGCTTSLIRVFAALGLASNLKTMTSEACKIGLSRSVDTGSSLVDCLTEAGTESLERLPKNHYLNKDKYF